MKLESLKGDKFSPFKENKLQNAIKIIGGAEEATTYRNDRYHGTDTIDVETYGVKDPKLPHTHFVDSNPRPGAVDYWKHTLIPN
ncbi:hypothetical protein LXD69_02060 [Flavobacterium sediminilitoris]|uniref:Uncharacterized protein n=1 Tax=Flavobacterium sediminilitoris TaxID=2024526 RepID=A0ABY4HQ49_9FLAO|nr:MULTISPECIES: hypothetical protein [Flavobacterium]UOX34312.1 hypothetical protein LXD69_02060 [Flavobacterium sediminilitoris]